MRKRIKKGGAVFLALTALAAVLASGQGTVYGADAIDTSKEDCAITFSLESSVIPVGKDGQEIRYEEYYDGLAAQSPETDHTGQPEINVQLYRVASVSAGGAYTAESPFDGLIFSDIGGAATAEQWLEKARAAAEIVEADSSLTADRSQNILEQDTISGLSTGLYLVYVEQDTVKTADYAYNFTPFLVSLPGNDYYKEGVEEAGRNDEWLYQVTVGLKPGRESLFGSLEITKTLEGYHEKLGKALFVFDVTAVKGNETVYSNVVSLEFDGTEETKTVRVDGIPAGATASVKEVYSGSSYQQISSNPQPVEIIAAGESGQLSGRVSFTNRYDGRVNGGGGVENHFEYIEEDNGGRWDFIPGSANRPAAGGDGQ